MRGVLRIFFGADGTRPFVVLTCLVLAGLAEAIGITTLLPAMTQLAGGSTDGSSPLNQQVLQVLDGLGIDPTIEILILLVVTGLTLKAVLSFIGLSYVGFSVANVATGLRTQLLGSLMNARWAYFTENRVGEVANSISVDATRAGRAYLTAAKFVAYMIQASLYAAVAVLMSWQLSVVGLAMGLIMMLTLNFLVRMSKRAGRKQTCRTSALVTYLTDTLNNIKPLKAMARQHTFAALLDKKVISLKKALRRVVIAAQGRLYGGEIIQIITLATAAYVAAVIWKIPLPELIVMGVILFQIVSLIGAMQKHLQAAVEVESAYWAVRRLIERSSGQPESNPGTLTPILERGCSFRNVSFSYPENPVLKNIDLDVACREITVLKGPSGSGKSTILDLLIGLHQPDEGEILIDDVPLSHIDLNKWRAMIGYVPQDLALFHDTIEANITLGDPSCAPEDIDHALKAAGAYGFVSGLPEGIQTVVGERGTKFSGGQRQRLAIARALIARPTLLILDEVTSALDPESEEAICRNIKALSRDYTIIAITHRPAWAEIATAIYEVEAGTVASPAGNTQTRVSA